MKNSSYGVFEINVLGLNDEVVETFKAYNDFTVKGFEYLIDYINRTKYTEGSDDKTRANPAYARYVKMGLGKSPTTVDMNDLEEPVFGYYAPYTESNTNGGNIYTAFSRLGLAPGDYCEIGLFDVDEDGNPTDMLCRATLFFDSTTSDVLKPRSFKIEEHQQIYIAYRIITANLTSASYRLPLTESQHDISQTSAMESLNAFRYMGNTNNDPDTDSHFVYTASYTRSSTMTSNDWRTGRYAKLEILKDPDIPGRRIFNITIDNPYTNPVTVGGVKVRKCTRQLSTDRVYYEADSGHMFQVHPVINIAPGKRLRLQFIQDIGIGPQTGVSPYASVAAYFTTPVKLASSYSSNERQQVPRGIKEIELFGPEGNPVAKTASISGTPAAIWSWTVSNNTYFNNNFILKQVTRNHDGSELAPVYFLPPVSSTAIYTVPGVSYIRGAEPALRATPSVATMTHLRIYTNESASEYSDIPITTLNTANLFTIPQTPFTINTSHLWCRWVGTAGIGNIAQINLGVTAPCHEIHKERKDETTFYLHVTRDLAGSNPITVLTAEGAVVRTLSNSYYTNPGEYITGLVTDTQSIRYDTYGPDGISVITVTKRVVDLPDIPHVQVIDNDLPELVAYAEGVKSTPTPMELRVYEGASENFLTVIAPGDGELRFYTGGRPDVVRTVPCKKLERISITNLRRTIELTSRGPLEVSYFDGVNESYTIKHYTTLPGRPDAVEIDYDPVENRLLASVGYNTTTIRITRWLVPVIDIPVQVGQTEVDVLLTVDLDPSARYEVYALSTEGYHSEIPAVIYPENEDPLDPPLIDLEKPDGIPSPTTNSATYGVPMPNFAVYGVDAFAGEIHGEPIIHKTCDEVEPGRWKCEVGSLNWTSRFQLWDSEIHDSSSNTLAQEGYSATLGSSSLAPKWSSFTMWSTWVRYDWGGFNAFVESGNIYKPSSPNAQTVGSMAQQHTGYYRVAWYARNVYNSSSTGVLLYDHEVNFNEVSSKYTNKVDMLVLEKADLENYQFIKINGVFADVSRVFDPVTNALVKTVISTPEYTFEHSNELNATWQLVNDPWIIGDSEWVNRYIRIQLGGPWQGTSSGSRHSHFRRGASMDGMSTAYLSSYQSSWSNAFAYLNSGRMSWSFYYKPWAGDSPIPYRPADWSSNMSFSDAVFNTWQDYPVDVESFKFYIDGNVVDWVKGKDSVENDDDGSLRSYYIINHQSLSYEIERRYYSNGDQSYGYIRILSSDDATHIVTLGAKTNYTEGTPADTSYGSNDFGEGISFTHFNLNPSSSSGIPLEWNLSPALIQPEEIDELPSLGFGRLRNPQGSPYIHFDGQVMEHFTETYDGDEYSYFYFIPSEADRSEEGDLDDPLTLDETETYPINRPTIRLYRGRVIPVAGMDGNKHIIQVQDADIEWSHSASQRMSPEQNLGEYRQMIVTDLIEPQRGISTVAFVLDTSLMDIAVEDLEFPEFDFGADLKPSTEVGVTIMSSHLAILGQMTGVLEDVDVYQWMSDLDWRENELSPEQVQQYQTWMDDVINHALTVKVNGESATLTVTLEGEGYDVRYRYDIEYADGDSIFIYPQGSEMYNNMWYKSDGEMIDVPLKVEILVSRPIHAFPYAPNGLFWFVDTMSGDWVEYDTRNYKYRTVQSGLYYQTAVCLYLGKKASSSDGATGPTVAIPPGLETGFFSLDGIYELAINDEEILVGTGQEIMDYLRDRDDVEFEEDTETLVIPLFTAPNGTILNVEGQFELTVNDVVYGSDLDLDGVLTALYEMGVEILPDEDMGPPPMEES